MTAIGFVAIVFGVVLFIVSSINVRDEEDPLFIALGITATAFVGIGTILVLTGVTVWLWNVMP